MNLVFAPFNDYFVFAEKNEKELLKANSPWVSAIRDYHEFFADHLSATEVNFQSASKPLLAMHAYMIYLASVRVALSGHSAAIFPLFRTALEASCYAFLIGETPDLERIWLERNSSQEAKKLCRKRFGSAVKEVAKCIQAKKWTATTSEEWINELYDATIDFGSHPNQRGVLPYVNLDQDRPDRFIAVELIALFGATSFETSRSLLACLDYGLSIATILTSCLEMPSETTLRELNRLNEIKEDLSENYFSPVDIATYLRQQ